MHSHNGCNFPQWSRVGPGDREAPQQAPAIVAGRRKDRLEELSQGGHETASLDLGADLDTLKKSVCDLVERYPDPQLGFTKELHINYTSVVGFASVVLPHFLNFSICSPARSS
ncbi:hypothetical protein NLJ89_g11536 [Agrocybe chaxingu]|uniref:Uncharacterized protein n=1 Tax=Agrocybe chaxingu TaxID=84603 RepID=A0A9W8JW46_9AGAR|nr:hypothetical protein NLJ89_g11536 [Agrocybe chaxingu]